MGFSTLYFTLRFLPLFLLVYLLSSKLKWQNRLLLVFSLVFYAFGGLGTLTLLLVLTVIVWYAGLLMENAAPGFAKLPQGLTNILQDPKKVFIGTLVVLLAVLGFFKYTGFFLGSLAGIFSMEIALPKILLPLGISFYIFKMISYLADVYMGKYPAERRFGYLLLYIVCFHHVLQGPILRYDDMASELDDRAFSYRDLSDGIYRFCIGMGKKVLLADTLGSLAMTFAPLGEEVAGSSVLALWLGSLCYTLQIYLDFSGYSDMALGLGQICGFHYKENFNYPYGADSVKDFWRKWHISLGAFFRDYVYFPLGGNRRGLKRTIINLAVVWALTGLWHGASWNFVAWGLYYFLFITLENLLAKANLSAPPKVLRQIYAFFVAHIGWVLFRYEDFGILRKVLAGMFGFGDNGFSDPITNLTLKGHLFFLIVAVLVSTVLAKRVGELLETKWIRDEKKLYYYGIAKSVAALLVLLLSVFAMVGNTFTPFLYNQF